MSERVVVIVRGRYECKHGLACFYVDGSGECALGRTMDSGKAVTDDAGENKDEDED